MLNKVLLVGNSGTTWKTNIHESKNHSQIAPLWLKNLITVQKNEKMLITVTVPTTLCFPLHGRENSQVFQGPLQGAVEVMCALHAG
jgi:hypothetical protein